MLSEFRQIPRHLSEGKESFKYEKAGLQWHPVLEIFANFVNSVDGTTFQWTDDKNIDAFTVSVEKGIYHPRPRGVVETRKNEYFDTSFAIRDEI